MKKVIALASLTILLAVGLAAYYKYHSGSPRIYIIGLDGASWNLMRPMMKEGKLPNIRRLMENGVYGNLKSSYPAHSAFLWTSIATGKVKEKHGIGDFLVDAGEKDKSKVAPATGNVRRVKAFWNILSEKGIPVSIVNWWVTWPPEQVKGVMVSDKYRGGQYRKFKMQVTYPASLQEQLPFPEITNQKAHADWEKYHLPELYDVTNDGRITAFDKALRSYPSYWCQDAAVRQASKYVLKNHPATVYAVVYRLVDISSHFFWCYLPLPVLEQARAKWKDKTITQADIDNLDQQFAKIVEPVYSYSDEIVGEVMNSAPKGSTFIIVSDHGFGFWETGWSHTTQPQPPDGIMILSGGPYRKGMQMKGASIYDITPTLLYQLGLPYAKDFDGKILYSAFEPEFQQAHKVALIPTWETGPRIGNQKPVRSEDENETLEDLRALGYIQ